MIKVVLAVKYAIMVNAYPNAVKIKTVKMEKSVATEAHVLKGLDQQHAQIRMIVLWVKSALMVNVKRDAVRIKIVKLAKNVAMMEYAHLFDQHVKSKPSVLWVNYVKMGIA